MSNPNPNRREIIISQQCQVQAGAHCPAPNCGRLQRLPGLRCPKRLNGSLTNPRWQKWFQSHCSTRWARKGSSAIVGCAGAEGNHNGWVHIVIVHCTITITITMDGCSRALSPADRCLYVSHRCHWLRAGGTEDMRGLEILKEETFIIDL